MAARSTRATGALARLNTRCATDRYSFALTGEGLFKLRERLENGEVQVSNPYELDDFVHYVNGLGPQKVLRVTKNDAAFAKQLRRSPKT